MDKVLEFYNDYIKEKPFSNEKLNCILADCLFRYIHQWESKKGHHEEKIINCIKKYNHKRFDQLLAIIKTNISETNRLLLIKCTYYESIDLSQMKTELPD